MEQNQLSLDMLVGGHVREVTDIFQCFGTMFSRVSEGMANTQQTNINNGKAAGHR
jgi:hypothetical protein